MDGWIEAARADLASLVSQRVVVRDFDNEETTGTIQAVGSAFVTVADEDGNRIVRLRIDKIRSVDDPPVEEESIPLMPSLDQ